MLLFETLKQPTDRTCQHTCLAMITGNTVEYVEDWFSHYGNDLPLIAEDAIIFLAHHGVYLAMYAISPNDEPMDIDGSEQVVTIPMKICDHPALIMVDSEQFPGKMHAVFWDGQNVLDPAYGTRRKLSEFKVREYWPVLLTEQQFERIKNS